MMNQTNRCAVVRARMAAAAFCVASPVLAQPVIDVPPTVIGPGTVLPSGATVNVFDGGVIPLSVDLANGELNIAGGVVALGATGIFSGFTNTNNTVNVTGGSVGPFFQLTSGTELNLSGGTMNTFGVFSGSTANITGGTVTGFPDVFVSGILNLSGGDVETIRALAGSTINITAQSFEIDGEPIDTLTPGSPMRLTQRGVVLSAVLKDGSDFEWTLRPFDPGFPSPDVALNSATINLILDESTACPVDLAEPFGTLNFFDLGAFLTAFNTQDPSVDFAAPFGVFNFFDLGEFLTLFNQGCP